MRDDHHKGHETAWEEQFPEAAQLCGKGLERLKEHGDQDHEGLEMLKRSANMGYPWGQYKYAISCFYHLEEPLAAFRYFRRSASAGHLDSLYHLGLIYQQGIAAPSRLSKDPCVAEIQIQREAAKCYQEAAEGGHWTARLKLGMMYLNGIGVGRNYRRAFKLIFSSACQNYPPAMAQLARLYLDERKAGYDPVEAYIWALLEANGEGCKIAEEIEPKLSPARIHSAQEEAARRQEILAAGGILTPGDIFVFTDKAEQNTAPPTGAAPENTPGAKARRSGLCLADWEVTDIRKLRIDLNPGEKSIVVRYGKRRSRFRENELFNPCEIALLTDYYKHRMDPREPRIGYGRNDHSLSRAYNRRRNNQAVVSDLNYKLRKYFGLDRGVRPFYWFGEKGSQDKVLKCGFQIEVHY